VRAREARFEESTWLYVMTMFEVWSGIVWKVWG